MRLNFTHAAIAALLLTACPPSDEDLTPDTDGSMTTTTEPTTTTTPTTGEPAETCPDHATADACCCFEATPADAPRSVENVCMDMSLCDTVEFDCNDIDGVCVSSTEAALQCALETLATGTAVGSLRFHYVIDSYYGENTISLYLQGDGTAYVIDREVLDLSDVHRPTGRFNLKPKAFFDECLASADVTEKSVCLETTVDGEITETCVGEIYNDAV